ncbi:MAG: DUF1189 family protein [Clostridia bacterium]
MESNQSKKEQFLKLNFFKKIWYSITKFEKYPELAALGVKKALIYFTELIVIFCVIYTGSYVYYVQKVETFEEENLSFSQKVIKTMIKETGSENEQINQALEIADNYSGPSMVGALFVSAFISFWIAIFLDVFTLSVFGLFTCLIAKIKMNYKAVFNMSVYAITLSLILRTIYVVVTMLTSFEIKYFDVMYVAVAYISLAAAIFLIKSDVIKKHLELMKIIEEGKEKIEQTIVIPRKKDDEEKKENKDGDKEEKKEDEKETEGQGSNA